jgi:hypothetical protein
MNIEFAIVFAFSSFFCILRTIFHICPQRKHHNKFRYLNPKTLLALTFRGFYDSM